MSNQNSGPSTTTRTSSIASRYVSILASALGSQPYHGPGISVVDENGVQYNWNGSAYAVGSGVSAYSALSDKATATLPTTNLPLQAALASKFQVDASSKQAGLTILVPSETGIAEKALSTAGVVGYASGASIPGAHDDGPGIQNAINAYSSSGSFRQFNMPLDSGLAGFKILSPLVINSSTLFNGNGKILEASLMAASNLYAISRVPDTIDTHNTRTPLCNVKLIGPQSEANALDGIYIGVTGGFSAGNMAGSDLVNVSVKGFRRNAGIGNQAWLNACWNCDFGNAYEANFYVGMDGTPVNNGESIEFHKCVFHDAHHSNEVADATLGNGIVIASGVQATVKMIGGSLDFNARAARVLCGTLNLIGVHLEDNTSVPSFYVEYVSGTPGRLYITNMTWANAGAIGSPPNPEPVGGKSIFLLVSGGLAVASIRDSYLYRFAKGNTEMISIAASRPQVIYDGNTTVSQANSVPTPSNTLNMIANGDFASSMAGWELPASVNYFNNGAFVAAVAGVGGTGNFTLPTNWSVTGTLATGLNEDLLLDLTTDPPRLGYRIYGTSSSGSGSRGLSMLVSTTTGAGLNQKWFFGAKLRVIQVGSGLVSCNFSIVERDSGGSGLANTSTAMSISRTFKWAEINRTFTQASAANVTSNIQLFYSNGVAIDATFWIQMPYLVLEGDPCLRDKSLVVLRDDPASAIPTARHYWNATAGNGGGGGLVITNSGTGDYWLRQVVSCAGRPGRKLTSKGDVSCTLTSGSVGHRVDWLDAAGNLVPNLPTYNPGGLITATQSYGQRGDEILVQNTAQSYAISAYTTSFNGTASYDNFKGYVN